MKKLIFMTLMLLVAVAAGAKGSAKISFDKTSHEFGNISARAGQVACTYEFTNTGDAPLIIINVTNGGCGCTTPVYPKDPIPPGKTGKITIKFDPTGRRGEFNRTVNVTTNAQKKPMKLKFSGVVVP